ncbi:hypothetical protein WJX72_007429 [[Myrmecia] bisecta]|uniref:Uncharacterized protein n=1 Tax=[Myrmecia] bisecta TaxID=41462 RepID=A0AAW1Q1F0_9CHLO
MLWTHSTANRRIMALSKTAHMVLWPIVFLMFCGWVLELGGLSAVQADCKNEILKSNPYNSAQLPIAVGCGKVYRYLWWILWFEFPIFLMICAAVAGGLPRGLGTGLLGLLAVCTALQMWGCNVALNLIDDYTGTRKKRARVLFAGFIITNVANCCAILALGAAEGVLRDSGDDDYGKHGYGRRPRTTGDVPAGTTTSAV